MLVRRRIVCIVALAGRAPELLGSSRSARRRLARMSRSRPGSSIATGACCAPTQPAKAAGGYRRGSPTSIRVSSPCCSPTRTSAFAVHHGVDPLALMRAAFQLRPQRPHSIRRLDADHAGGAASGAAQRAERLAAKLRQIVRAIEIERALSKDDILDALSRTRALWRQHRRHARRVAGLFRQGAAAADARRSRASGRAAAIAGGAAARPLAGGRARGARPRARSVR